MKKQLYRRKDKYRELFIVLVFVLLIFTEIDLHFLVRVLAAAIILLVYFGFFKNTYRVSSEEHAIVLENPFETKNLSYNNVISVNRRRSAFTLNGDVLNELGYNLLCKEEGMIREYNVYIGKDYLNEWNEIIDEIKSQRR